MPESDSLHKSVLPSDLKRSQSRNGKAPSKGSRTNGAQQNGTHSARVTDHGLNDALRALADGDFSVRLSAGNGAANPTWQAFNRLAQRLDSMSERLVEFSRVVGRDGDMRARFELEDCRGGWAGMGASFNALARDLARPSTEVARVLAAVAAGDLSQEMPLEIDGKPLLGEFLRIGTTVNTMVGSLNTFASEVTRVAREVGTEGKLGGQARVPGVAGTWKDLTDNVNSMASNLTDQVRNIALVTTAVANGDLSKKITVDVKGELLALKDTINTMVDQLRSFSAEVTRVAREVGTEGKLGGQAHVPGVGGTWKDLTDSVNSMASNLTTQVRGIAKVVTAVANGELSKRLVVEAKGEVAELAETINAMTETLKIFGEEVTRVAREVGTEGKLGGQARVPGVAGTWKDLTDSVNSMASNLTTQVRGIVKVVTAVAHGDLSQKFSMQSQGEIAALADTINTMTGTLHVFADQVITVAREVGTEGRLGGQAKVPGAAGTWRDLTDHVNQLANNLTTQVRAMAEVATAVTDGDLTRSITVEAQGELLALKERVNQMIANLRETTQKNYEQDWLKTNLAKFGSMMQGQKSLESVSRMIMSELTPLVGASHGAFFVMDEQATLRLVASYAFRDRKLLSNRYAEGEGLVGQCALERKSIVLTNVPVDYIQIGSGLGEAPPRNVLVVPILFEGEVRAVIEVASFEHFSPVHRNFLDQVSASIGVVLNVIAANSRTEELLEQSQSLANELQTQQQELKRSNTELAQQAKSLRQSEEMLKEQREELQQVNEELEEKAALLADQKKAVEVKNREVETARTALEEKAEQLAVSARYKSEFLANMSHELRTPLNSLLILARLLTENKEGNLSAKQVEYAQTIQSSGADLLSLINEVLDLSKVESGKIEIEVGPVEVSEVLEYQERAFRPLAQQKAVEFALSSAADAPPILTLDRQRLQQILGNLIGNAFKFTESGRVELRYYRVPPKAVRYDAPLLAEAPERVVAFAVSDTGIGIPPDKQHLVFEAFQQADGTTSRKYGGTGLGLSISRELSRLLGGEMRVESQVGKGSVFTLYLPLEWQPIQQSVNRRASSLRDGLGAMVIPDDRDSLTGHDRVILIVESEREVAERILAMARERAFKGVVTLDGSRAVSFARLLRPDAIVLDLQLDGTEGLEVLERLKNTPDTRHIPIHVISESNQRRAGLRLGAVAHIHKPASRETLRGAFDDLTRLLEHKARAVLIVEDDAVQRRGIVELIADSDVEATDVASAEEALSVLATRHFDCMVLDLGLPGTSGFELLDHLATLPDLANLPVIVYTSRDLSRQEETQLKRYARSIILKDARSPARLLEEMALFLHRVEGRLPEAKRLMLREVPGSKESLSGKTVLIVDDDVRNIFALTTVLEESGMRVLFAENGRDGIDLLEQHPEVCMVLLDVMMPEMDGYEAARQIRANPAHQQLPVIALTAKAMKGDREKCIQAGASDYVTKPVDPERLLSLMRVWLYSANASFC